MAIITVSELWGCGGEKIATQVAQQMNMELFNDARLQAEALKMGVRSDDLKGIEEKAPVFYDQLFCKILKNT